MAEWKTCPLNANEASGIAVEKGLQKTVIITRRVVIQCKASKRALNKSSVTDIRDTIETHDANGYFLATSTYLSSGLTTHLEKMRNKKNYFIDWWTKTEIEEHLRKHPYVCNRYSGIVKIKKNPT